MPIIYGMGLYYINNLINNIKNPKKHRILRTVFAIAILSYFSFSTVTNYTIQKEHIENTHYFVIDDNDLKLYDWINKNNITNQEFLNFGEDAGQYLPLYTKNMPYYYFTKFSSNKTKFGNLTFNELCQLVDNKNYEKFVNVCKEENISYIFISDYIGQYDGGFFNNTKYFEILYQSGNAKIVKVK
ncbi:hypothetical protein [Methanotorris igneus]|uniref:hypothetical protein n=1 Tax=Methanotorris igneus TaxID=2189 RepID=UPI00155A0650|nr:hypothetical protein [Methanotorris igneus]